MWRHNRLNAKPLLQHRGKLQVRDCSVLGPKIEYTGNFNHPRYF